MGAFIMSKNQLVKIMSAASLLGVQVGVLSLGSLTLSLGVNLVHVDSNVAEAAVEFKNIGDSSGPSMVVNANLNTTPTEDPILFASEIFGSGSSAVLPSSDSKNLMGVYYKFDGEIAAKFNAKFTLDAGVFADTVSLICSFSTTASLNSTAISGGSNKNYVTFEIDGEQASAPVMTGDSCTLTYNITGVASKLQDPGQSVKMTATMMTAQPSYPVSPARTIDVAGSKSALSVTIVADTDLDDRISVASGNTEFSSTESTTKATIGYLTIKDVNDAADTDATSVKDDTASTLFNVANVDGEKTTLTITDGQFKASVAAGGVSLVSTIDTPPAPITVLATDETTAVFNLDGTKMATLINAANHGEKGFAIKIVADGKSDINVNENPPVAELHVEYTDPYVGYAAVTYPAVELKKIKQDGTRCVVYNVPAPGSADIVAVRITNDSGVDGIINATLYDGSGAEIFAAQPLNGGNPVKAQSTLAVFNTDLATLGSWSGRGVLVITTTLPSIEVLGLLREANNNAAPLTNLSTGATGSGCSN
jgi:hypothetical protein